MEILGILKSNIKLDDFELINYLNLSTTEKEMVRTWRNLEDVRKWMYNDHIISKEEHSTFLDKLHIDCSNFYWLVRHIENGYLGVLSINKVDLKNKHAYFGTYANPESKILGKGYLLDKLAIKLAFNEINLHSLKLEVIEKNKGVIFLHKKVGFEIEGKLKEYVLKKGQWENVVVMGILNRK
ncbi:MULTISPECIES: UDP-4-amino-4,6-dideoxy-N-acetyl-beta-L-altrosamine N-acetyltransferase [Methanohalophilus]|jgi:UDP-4-amino-4,6-dideoxy-N-acetyl-beta-L-altrosamine N-acetyltransferase|uniref:UDP-4-amino-4, 6-dideoxy-N-acetyl-beta-L-altrosamine N-acetyltransferase n=1 Tax=Methanohalophilus euhalobius TaxID=51203 RepID=A0A314ZQ25_9EURY|nr:MULTISPECIES: UDP-4-amino-4,6-dideoxy-N-acetyl-beta-L-altrosamine N-acetyltransferase [Methanohalophilus]OBZ34776.1 MAG: UDP-4-amino-4,6-dideoxy-N-acetyl-beta-L-altrosamine N-acetyltransferase [Methanohalophilus sp. DAL1]PQV41839.1 UDP-4-amino-4,6-dideoxy-N-acetyl-beta-L-altrosamine N-acetyltransferase [Methanohalophilus euhalobius]RNI07234.1 UDP-4-amino-4,6-dideoxy-N-acetyl-beta-L-altrosamine N-acetyltransferase [Methanohalophilus euhalobius]